MDLQFSQASELQSYNLTQGKEKDRRKWVEGEGRLKMREEGTDQLCNLSKAPQLLRVSARITPHSVCLHSQGFIYHAMMTHSIF